jgi:hypothetical protein
MNLSEKIRRIKHVHDIIEDRENEAEAIDKSLDAINKELSCDNNISVSAGVKIVNVKGRKVIQDILIQIWTDEIGKVTKKKKSTIIDFNDEEDWVEVPKVMRKSWEKNIGSKSDCGVDVFYDDEKMSLLAAPTRDTQTMQQ